MIIYQRSPLGATLKMIILMIIALKLIIIMIRLITIMMIMMIIMVIMIILIMIIIIIIIIIIGRPDKCDRDYPERRSHQLPQQKTWKFK